MPQPRTTKRQSLLSSGGVVKDFFQLPKECLMDCWGCLSCWGYYKGGWLEWEVATVVVVVVVDDDDDDTVVPMLLTLSWP